VSNPKTKEEQEGLNERLRSLKIERPEIPPRITGTRTPKLVLLGVAALIALVAFAYLFFFSSAKPISPSKPSPPRLASLTATISKRLLKKPTAPPQANGGRRRWRRCSRVHRTRMICRDEMNAHRRRMYRDDATT